MYIKLKRYIFALSIMLILSSAVILSADEGTVGITIDKDKIPLSGSLRMDITFYHVKDMKPPSLPEIDGFRTTYLRSSNIISKVAGEIAGSTRHTYILMPKHAGSFKLGPFEFFYNKKRYATKQIEVVVTGGLADTRTGSEGLSTEEKFFAKENSFLLIEPERDTVYENQSFAVTINLYYKRMHLTDIDMPVIAHKGFSMEEFRPPTKTKKEIKGDSYNLISFSSRAFATQHGNMGLGPARITCSRIDTGANGGVSGDGYGKMNEILKKYGMGSVAKDMYGENKKYPLSLTSPVKNIKVMPLPETGRPANFAGAIGDFQFDLKTDVSGTVKTGDAITVYMKISGAGNLDIISPPIIKERPDFILYEPFLKSHGERYKSFEQVLVPRTTAFKAVPAVEFSYFDPTDAHYKTIRRGPIPVKVIETHEVKEAKIMEEAKRAGENKSSGEENIGRDIVYIKDSPGPPKKRGAYLYNNRIFLAAQTLPLIAYLSTLIVYKRYERLKNDVRYARSLVAYKKAKKGLRLSKALLADKRGAEFYAQIFNTMQEYLGDKFNMPPGGITSCIIDETLQPKGFDGAVLDRLRKFFNDCGAARFTPSDYDKKGMAQITSEAKAIIEYFRKA